MRNIREFITIFTMLFLFNYTFSQDSLEVKKLFKKIEFTIDYDRKVIDNKINITLYNRPQPKKSEVVIRTLDAEESFEHWMNVKPDFIYEISKATCETIEELILSMDFNNFVQFDNRIGIHGYRCKLIYGDNLSSIALNAWSPTSGTLDRKLQTYLKICNLILKVSKMKELE